MKNDLKHLRRSELIDLIYEMKKREIELQTRLDEAEAKLQDREITMEKAGTIADAAVELSGVFQAAQEAADTYLKSIKAKEKELAHLIQGCFMNYPWADLTYCILAITSLILFLIHWSCKKAQINSISLYRTFFQRYSFYIVNRDWLCLETHTVPAKRHCHKSSPSFLSLYLPDPSRTLPDAGCCMRIF